jgi:hypothetical protein
VSVRVVDRDSGVDVHRVTISFGDGRSARGRALVHHRYAHPGVYLVTARVRDRIGNAGVVRQLVSVP